MCPRPGRLTESLIWSCVSAPTLPAITGSAVSVLREETGKCSWIQPFTVQLLMPTLRATRRRCRCNSSYLHVTNSVLSPDSQDDLSFAAVTNNPKSTAGHSSIRGLVAGWLMALLCCVTLASSTEQLCLGPWPELRGERSG